MGTTFDMSVLHETNDTTEPDITSTSLMVDTSQCHIEVPKSEASFSTFVESCMHDEDVMDKDEETLETQYVIYRLYVSLHF